MDRSEMRTMGTRMLGEARALRAAFPDKETMRALRVGDRPPESGGELSEFRAALVYLRDEMLLVRDGKADSLTVLNDEIAHTESLMPRL